VSEPERKPLPRKGRGLLFLLPFLLLLPATPAAAGQAIDLLERFYERIGSLHARFDQQVVTESGEVQEESGGEVWIQRPDHFRWDYKTPYPQKIIANGRTVKFYDPDMKQVTVRSYSAGVGHTPSMVLAGGGNLERHFKVSELGREEGLYWVELVPKEGNESGFRSARVGLEADPVRLRRFHFRDAFGNRTRIRFQDIEVNPDLATSLFQFQAPPGTEILGEQSRSE
jgi:outer membrane lipoprotein carrier protein